MSGDAGQNVWVCRFAAGTVQDHISSGLVGNQAKKQGGNACENEAGQGWRYGRNITGEIATIVTIMGTTVSPVVNDKDTNKNASPRAGVIAATN
ncbi:hypothetical protein HA50_18490 [Pantoea cypripedii]|uniref:Uncharacterized protein n=1 Tax=Pantoea cypripedii TaxID=55209 RepID=A0A1X1EZA5_PANCY|nr:hypothetical protein HA50_18490 [Pantoea cypripedii]